MNYSVYKYRRELFARIWALLLLSIFLNATLIESLHHHVAGKVSYCKQSSASAHQQLDSAKLKCKLCEVLKHRSHFFDLPAPITFALSIVKPEVKSCIYFEQHTSAYLLSCTNKGPPRLGA
ncbi:hypothetical protein [Pedobacter roseus]|uniref:DUF2946 domain-containing protein n=1 Tax=Pedobacter roseus TaxID=336820 RepID=A0A7G9QAP4_9SPHI|nr:hypothetical protein [Pedobacter roseus]QNN40419.1 hypothetical protein H9L23_14820 [Pedobacter roseus]